VTAGVALLAATLTLLVPPTVHAHNDKLVGVFNSVLELLGEVKRDMPSGGGCQRHCPPGQFLKQIKEPEYDGCGSYDFHLNTDSLPPITECCNQHDICYDTCGEDRDDCDRRLKACVKQACNTLKEDHAITEKGYEECNELSQIVFNTVNLLGCKAFRKSQEKSCDCVPVD